MTLATTIKENIYLGLAHRFRGLVLFHVGKHGVTHADMMLER